MRFPRRWLNPLTVSSGHTVTVLWTEEGASLVLWQTGPGKAPRYVSQRRVAVAADCTEAFTGACHSLVREFGPGKIPFVWIFLPEAFPGLRNGAGGEAANAQVRLPEWIADCLRELPALFLPNQVLDGTSCLDRALVSWPPYREPGTAIILFMGSRLLLLAHDERGCFRRYSRAESALVAESRDLQTEWIRQTRTLYRGRTGLSLDCLLYPGPEDGSIALDSALKIRTDLIPPGWVGNGAGLAFAARLYLHRAALETPGSGECRLEVAELRRRWRRTARERSLKVSVIFLAAACCLALLGACRSHGDGQPDQASLRLWSQSAREWQQLDRQYRKLEEKRRGRTAPYRLVGTIARSAGPGLDLQGIRIRRGNSRAKADLRLEIEGRIPEESASGELRDWIHSLKQMDAISSVENLRLERDGEEMRFHLNASSGIEGVVE